MHLIILQGYLFREVSFHFHCFISYFIPIPSVKFVFHFLCILYYLFYANHVILRTVTLLLFQNVLSLKGKPKLEKNNSFVQSTEAAIPAALITILY